MAIAAPTPCRYPGCPALLSTPGYCDKHLRSIRKQQGNCYAAFPKFPKVPESGSFRSRNSRSPY
ncbi:MAG: hypothetical protein ACYCY8_12535, partial [Burkholderiales bacterium]